FVKIREGAAKLGLCVVMAGHSRSKNGVASPAYVPAIHVLARCRKKERGSPGLRRAEGATAPQAGQTR
ncbi:MAG: hypothetical protein WBF99_01390, partial [Xanthobacteraceae bacterium]